MKTYFRIFYHQSNIIIDWILMNSYLLWSQEQRLLQRFVNRFLFFTVRTIIFMENTKMFKVRDINIGKTFILTHATPTCREIFARNNSRFVIQHAARGRRISQGKGLVTYSYLCWKWPSDGLWCILQWRPVFWNKPKSITSSREYFSW